MPEPTIPSGNPAQPGAAINGDVAGNASAGASAQAKSPDVAAGDDGPTDNQADNSGLSDKLATMGNEAAKYRKAISAMGISPDDDLVQQLADGVLTPEDLRARFGPTTQAQHPAAEPKSSPFARMQAVAARIQNGQPTEADFKEYVTADLELKTEQLRTAQANESRQTFNDCKAAAVAVLESDPTFKSQPEKIQAIEKKLFWAAVDVAVGDGVPPGVDPARFLNRNTYSHYAQQVLANDMAALRGHYSGKPSVPNQPSGPAGINPLGAADGGATIETPRSALNFSKVPVSAAMSRYFQETSPGAV